MGWLWFILVGILAGWIAGKLTQGRGFGLLHNLIIGVIGALLGGFIFQIVGVQAVSLIGSLAMSVIGALVLLFILQQFKKR